VGCHTGHSICPATGRVRVPETATNCHFVRGKLAEQRGGRFRLSDATPHTPPDEHAAPVEHADAGRAVAPVAGPGVAVGGDRTPVDLDLLAARTGEAVARHMGNKNLPAVFPGFDNQPARFLKFLG